MSESDLDRAREMFFGYDGSRFDMMRDGVEAEYERFDVPSDVEQRWLDELTASKVSTLEQSGNWQAVLFLAGHRDHRHLDRILAAGPLGEWWERISFDEALLKYVDMACRGHFEPDRLARICRGVVDRARELAQGVPPDQRPDRVALLVDSANRLEASLPWGRLHP